MGLFWWWWWSWGVWWLLFVRVIVVCRSLWWIDFCRVFLVGELILCYLSWWRWVGSCWLMLWLRFCYWSLGISIVVVCFIWEFCLLRKGLCCCLMELRNWWLMSDVWIWCFGVRMRCWFWKFWEKSWLEWWGWVDDCFGRIYFIMFVIICVCCFWMCLVKWSCSLLEGWGGIVFFVCSFGWW